MNLYLSPNGNDNWSGKMPRPSAEKSDGPFGSEHRLLFRDLPDLGDGLFDARDRRLRLPAERAASKLKAPFRHSPQRWSSDSGLSRKGMPQPGQRGDPFQARAFRHSGHQGPCSESIQVC